eukprot:CAMPEP_0180024198 /NCGR_PEP_ID=MMETSP0984-20121128/23956_1 /TAXON_ID=483367 /ORGANISM="non described non described, Strain CCMP 2436" /LENGTH=145 /DNA_ID=CAMNT_0021948671 /DNA_START=157 /DNA_END=591 /DNA_ORIENTATION=+
MFPRSCPQRCLSRAREIWLPVVLAVCADEVQREALAVLANRILHEDRLVVVAVCALNVVGARQRWVGRDVLEVVKPRGRERQRVSVDALVVGWLLVLADLAVQDQRALRLVLLGEEHVVTLRAEAQACHRTRRGRARDDAAANRC